MIALKSIFWSIEFPLACLIAASGFFLPGYYSEIGKKAFELKGMVSFGLLASVVALAGGVARLGTQLGEIKPDNDVVIQRFGKFEDMRIRFLTGLIIPAVLILILAAIPFFEKVFVSEVLGCLVVIVFTWSTISISSVGFAWSKLKAVAAGEGRTSGAESA